jgi:hypothetical protein
VQILSRPDLPNSGPSRSAPAGPGQTSPRYFVRTQAINQPHQNYFLEHLYARTGRYPAYAIHGSCQIEIHWLTPGKSPCDYRHDIHQTSLKRARGKNHRRRTVSSDRRIKRISCQEISCRTSFGYDIAAQPIRIPHQSPSRREPRRVSRRLFRLSHAAMAGSSSMA